MRHTPATLCGAALLLLLTFSGSARADLIYWSYSWSRSPSQVPADSPGTGYIALTDEGLKNAVGNTDIVATNIKVHSTAPPSAPDKFTNAPYTLSLYLMDQASGVNGTLAFTGIFNGTISALNSNIANAFTGLVTQTLILGDNKYTVTIGPYVPPGPPASTSSGSIGTHATVKVESIISEMPEPSTLILATAALPLLSLAVWSRLRNRKQWLRAARLA
jgi:hypothetical protein